MIAGSLIVRLAASALIGPGFDEAYYHEFSRRLAWSYFDHPPLVAFVAGFGRWLTGAWAPLTLRLGAVLVFTFALPGFYLLAGRMYGRDAARLALLLPHATPYFLVGAGAFVIPDNALAAAWIWALVVTQRLREHTIPRTGGFILLGALAGIALLAKYHAVLLPASLVVASTYDRELRRWWLDLRLYLALLVAAASFAPVIVWNAGNGWISFAEQFGKGTSGEFRLRFDLIGQAIGGQIGYLTPWVAVALYIGAFRRRALGGGKPGGDRWLVAFFLTPVIAFTLVGLTRGILPHWTMPGYIAAFALAAGGFAWSRRTRRYTTAAVAVNLALVAVVLVQGATGLIRLAPNADPTLDPAGWRETIRELERSGELREGDLIFAHKWFTAGELAWADRGRHELVLLGDDPHMYAWWAPETVYRGRGGVFITQRRYGIDPVKKLERRFVRVERLPIDTVRAGSRLVRMAAWRVEGLVNPHPPPYGPHAPLESP
ncbi:MAG: Lipopolysaccharide core galacturonosyltransferase RgtA [Calditrichaeota bacterium]|nr:Lipopolysaccharide core galacturonosyltransferase RgtA [Calditrichota bacterium]